MIRMAGHLFLTLLFLGVAAPAAAQGRAVAQGQCNQAFANTTIAGSVRVLCNAHPREMLEIKKVLDVLLREGRANSVKLDQIITMLQRPDIIDDPTKIAAIARNATTLAGSGASPEALVSSFERVVDDAFFDVERLGPQVKMIVARARAAQSLARTRAIMAEAYASRARVAADRALRGAPGTLNISENGKTYRGESPFGRNDAVGVAFLPDGTRYEGSFLSDFTMTGYGVQYNQRGFQLMGKFVNTVIDEVGVLLSTSDGLRYEGNISRDGQKQVGVAVVPGGGRFDGEVTGPFDGTGGLQRNGIGAEWTGTGGLINGGRYTQDRLIEPMSAGL